jgi:hypothetical protein
MKDIEKGDFFHLNTENRMKGFELIVKQLKQNKTFDKGRAVRKLREEEVYQQKKDCKDFIKNIIRAKNTEIVSVGRRKIALTGKMAVKSQ